MNVQGNHSPFITKISSTSIMTRIRLQNKFVKNKNDTNRNFYRFYKIIYLYKTITLLARKQNRRKLKNLF